MNAMKAAALKALACRVVAATVTLVGSYAFVASTAVVRTAAAPAHTPASAARTHLAQAGSTGLLQ